VGIGTHGFAPYPFQTPMGIQYQNVPVDIDEGTLNKIATTTGGKYFRATNNATLKSIYEKIDKLEKAKIDVTQYHKKTELYLPFALIALGFLLLEFILKNTLFRGALTSQMLRFAHIDILWGLVAIPVFIFMFLEITRWKRKAIKKLGDREVVKQMMPDVSFSRPWIKFILFAVAYSLCIIGAADPQIGSKVEEVKRKGADLMILLDVSNSMLAQDLAPSRLENAKRAIAQLIDNLHDDRIGLIVFAGQAYVQLPVTTDYSAAKLFLSTINTNMVPTQGTAIGAAIDLGMKSFDFKNGTGKAMIIITDGENHEDDAVAAAKNATDKDVSVHVIGVGSVQGAPIPYYQDGKQMGFHKDEDGKTDVLSKLNEDMCKEIAAAGNGAYVRATNANSGFSLVMDQIAKIQRKTVDSKSFKEYEDRFQFFLGFALLLLVAEFFISNRKSQRLSNLKLFEVKNK
jgi:Ca-activated chloride channel family protein